MRTKFVTKNGITMILCKPLNFIEEKENADDTGDFFYYITVGNILTMFTAVYIPKSNVLSISEITYGASVPLRFHVESFEEASDIINRFAKAQFPDEDVMEDTIYKS